MANCCEVPTNFSGDACNYLSNWSIYNWNDIYGCEIDLQIYDSESGYSTIGIFSKGEGARGLASYTVLGGLGVGWKDLVEESGSGVTGRVYYDGNAIGIGVKYGVISCNLISDDSMWWVDNGGDLM